MARTSDTAGIQTLLYATDGRAGLEIIREGIIPGGSATWLQVEGNVAGHGREASVTIADTDDNAAAVVLIRAAFGLT